MKKATHCVEEVGNTFKRWLKNTELNQNLPAKFI